MALMPNGGGGVGDFAEAGPAPGAGDASWGGYVPPSLSDPAAIEPLTPSFEDIAVGRPGPDGKGGTVPGDPLLGQVSYDAPDQPSPTTLTASVKERVGNLSCYEFHNFDLICGNSVAPNAVRGYFVGTNPGSNFPCQSSPGVGTFVPTSITGDGTAGCYTIFTSPGGPSCLPKCESTSNPSGSNSPVATPPPLIGSVNGSGPKINSIQNPGEGELDVEVGIGQTLLTAKIASGGFAAITVSGGGHVNLQTGVERDQLTPIASIPQPGSPELDSGDPSQECCNTDNTPVVTSLRTRPSDGSEPWTYYPTPNTGFLTAAISCVPCSGPITGQINQNPNGTTLPAGQSTGPTPPQNDPRPKPTTDNSQGQPQQTPGKPNGGLAGKIQQIIIIQDDSSQHFVGVVGSNG